MELGSKRHWAPSIDKTGRKYRPVSREEGDVKDFGGISTVSIVLPTEHGSPRLLKMERSQAQNTKQNTEILTDRQPSES